jgi:hypothetical protein
LWPEGVVVLLDFTKRDKRWLFELMGEIFSKIIIIMEK